jgi:hypothetical protein
MFSILKRFNKPWRSTYLKEVEDELEIARRDLITLQHLTRVTQGKIAALEETLKSPLLQPPEEASASQKEPEEEISSHE